MSIDEDNTNKQGRLAALVIAGSMVFWLIVQWLGPKIGLSGKYAILIDLFVLAALFWALVVVYQMWRKRQKKQ